MDLPLLLAKLRTLGATATLVTNVPTLRVPFDLLTAADREELAAGLRRHRAEVMTHFGLTDHPGRVCPRCRAVSYTDDREDVFRLCWLARGEVQCPAWTEGLAGAPAWLGKERWFREKRRQDEERQNTVEIPE